jgi:hypothetical protein
MLNAKEYKLCQLTSRTMKKLEAIRIKKKELIKSSKQLELTFSENEYNDVVLQLGQLELESNRLWSQIKMKINKKLLPYTSFNLDFKTKTIYMTMK